MKTPKETHTILMGRMPHDDKFTDIGWHNHVTEVVNDIYANRLEQQLEVSEGLTQQEIQNIVKNRFESDGDNPEVDWIIMVANELFVECMQSHHPQSISEERIEEAAIEYDDRDRSNGPEGADNEDYIGFKAGAKWLQSLNQKGEGAQERYDKAVAHHEENMNLDDWDVLMDSFRIAAGLPPNPEGGKG